MAQGVPSQLLLTGHRTRGPPSRQVGRGQGEGGPRGYRDPRKADAGPGARACSGQYVETSLMGGLVSMLAYVSAEYFATGRPLARSGKDHPIAAPYGLFEASDGHIAVAPPDAAYVRRFLRVIGLEALLDRPEYATNEARRERRRELADAINERTRTRSVEWWIERLNEGGCPCGRVMDASEVFADPQVLAQDLVLDVPHPGAGTVRTTGFPVKLSGTPCAVFRPAPRLGEHTGLRSGTDRRPRRPGAASGSRRSSRTGDRLIGENDGTMLTHPPDGGMRTPCADPEGETDAR